jgi:uncharacterized protein (TIGR00255 family)
MTSSMTAFARIQVQEDWGSLVWEIRSVNHRYLEPHFRLPELMREIEPSLREALRKHLNRGKVECSLKMQLCEGQKSLNVNETSLAELQAAVNKVEAYFINASGVNPLEVLQWPGIVNNEEANMRPVHAAALKGFELALVQLSDTRRREGMELEKFVTMRLEGISEEVENIRKVLPDLLDSQRQKILDRLEEARAELDPDRLEQEMIILAQKMDVDEELDRLTTHVTEVKRTLGKKGAVGRRLDFLMQELNREANTLSSKSINAGLTQSAVNLKVLIEQAREQIQNIE